jgi:hypothetical protein
MAVVLTCTIVASASAIAANYQLQQQTPNPTEAPSDIQTPSSPSTSTSPPSASPTPSPSPQPTSSPTPSSSPQPTETAPNSVSNLFDAELTYVYVGPTNSTGEGMDYFGFGVPMYPSNYYPVTVVLELTFLGNPENEPFDARFEGYLVKLSADTGATASYLGWLGTNFDPSFSNLPPFPRSPSDPPQSVYFRFNLTLSESQKLQISDAGSYGSSPGSLGLWSNGAPNTITVTVQRAGWVTVCGKSTSTLTDPASDIILQVQLEKSGDGFLFGTKT